MGALATFFLWTACTAYVLSAVFALVFLRNGKTGFIKPTALALFSGCVLLFFALTTRGLAMQRLPLVGPRDALDLLILLAGCATVPVVRRPRAASLVCFHAPVLAALCLLGATFVPTTTFAPERALRSMPLILHVGIAFLAYAYFLSGGLTSAAYVLQARRLKRHQPTGVFEHLPSLEELDKTLWASVRRGYLLFAITLLIGLSWAYTDRNLLGDYWYLSPKVLLSFVMVVFYAGCFHARRRGWLHGPRIAYWMLVGFLVFFTLYLVLELTGLRTYQFWGMKP